MIPNKYVQLLAEKKQVPQLIKKIKGKSDYKYSVYTNTDIQKVNSNIKSILQSNYPTILFKTETESVLNSTGERLHCKVDWKATPLYKGKEDVLEGLLHNNKNNLKEYISRRLKLDRLLRIDYFMDQ